MFVDTDSLIMTIHDSYKVSLSPSDNFRLPEVLPDVPPVVHLEVLTYKAGKIKGPVLFKGF